MKLALLWIPLSVSITGSALADSRTLERCYPKLTQADEPAPSGLSNTPPTDVVAWPPPALPAYVGVLAVNDALGGSVRIGEDRLDRAEDIAIDEKGRLYTGTTDGFIWRVTPAAPGCGQDYELSRFAEIGSRALGLDFDPCGNLIAAVPGRGVVAVSPDGEVATLVDRVDGTRLDYANGLAVARDGTIYITDASTKYVPGWPYDFLEGVPHGRVLAYEPQDGTLTLLADELHFANGIVVAEDESFLLFAESWRGRVQRHWLTGPSAGETAPFAENLPVIPDRVSLDARGRLWVTGQRRTPELDGLAASRDARLALLGTIDPAAPPPADLHQLVIVLDEHGALLRSLHATDGSLYALSAAIPHGRSLWLGSNVGAGIARVELPRDLFR